MQLLLRDCDLLFTVVSFIIITRTHICGETYVGGVGFTCVNRVLRSNTCEQELLEYLEMVVPFWASNGIVADEVIRIDACLAHHVDGLS